MKLSFKRSFYALFVLVLTAVQASAITPRQLVAPFFAEEEHAAFGGADLQALLKDESRPLGQIAAKIVLPLVKSGELQPAVLECIEHMGAFVFHSGGKGESERRETVFAAEVAGALPAAPEDAGFVIENVPEGTTLTPVGVYSLNGQKVYCAFLYRDGQNFIIAAENDPALLSLMAAVPADTKPENESMGASPLWASGYTPPSRFSQAFKKDILPQALQTPLRFELSLDHTERSIRARVRSNLNEFLPFGEVPVSGEKPFLIGSDSLYGLLSFEGLYSALEKHQDKIAQAAAAAGFSSEEIAAVLSRRITIGAAGKSSSLIGSFPGVYVHLAGANQAVAEKLLSLVKAAASDKSTKMEPFSQGAWHGVRMSRWSMLSAYAAASDQGFVIAFQDARELTRTPRPAPEIEKILAENHPFVLCFDSQALMDKLDSALGMLGSLFMNDEQQRQMESAFKLMEAFGVFTLTADRVEEHDAELFINQPAFGRLLDDLSARIRLSGQNKKPVILPAAPEAPVTPAPSVPASPAPIQAVEPTLQFSAFLRASSQFKKLFPAASIAPQTCVASALYDGKPVTMTSTLIEGEGVQLRFVSATSSAKLHFGPERTERLVRQWRENNPSSPCELTCERTGDTAEVELSMVMPYSDTVTDAEFVRQADQFLAGLDSFYDLLK